MTQPQPHDASSASGANAAGPRSDPALQKQILEEALRQMHAVRDDSNDYALFLAAAREMGRQPFSASPVVEGLVRCALTSMFPKTNWDSPRSQGLIQELSATLFADPASAARLEGLWNRLLKDL